MSAVDTDSETVLFLLGENFRWTLLGDDEDGENDEDSVVNDLEFHLSNYEADWKGTGMAPVLEHWGWEHLRKVLWVKRNSGRVMEMVEQEIADGDISAQVAMPVETTLESAYWVIKALMRRARPLT